MQAAYYEQLMAAASDHSCLSIAIDAEDAPITNGPVPWVRTVSAFNMRTPNITLAIDDLEDETIREALKACAIIGCYIFVPLNDYGFLANLTHLQDLFIRCADKLHDLSFTQNMPDLFMLYVEGATLPDLRPLVSTCNRSRFGPGRCFGFNRCVISDTSALAEIDFPLSELLVWPAPGDRADRWTASRRPGIFRFYDGSGDGSQKL